MFFSLEYVCSLEYFYSTQVLSGIFLRGVLIVSFRIKSTKLKKKWPIFPHILYI